LYQVAPVSTNLIYSYVAEHVLGLPRSFWLFVRILKNQA
jgi:acyl-CoA dehydrogenase